MKIHLKQIRADGLHLEGEEDCPIRDLEPEGVRCAGAMRYKIDAGVSGSSFWASGSLVQPVELTCVSCLEKFVHEINVPAFAFQTELHGPETVDLTPFVREDILLNLPAYPHCDADEQRKCKGPIVPPTPKTEVLEEAAKREHDWEALDKLKLRK